MSNTIWSFIVVGVGLVGFFLAGRKVWWAWYVNIGCQLLWFWYGIISQQWGFVFSAVVYSLIFTQNAVRWTKEHKEAKAKHEKWMLDYGKLLADYWGGLIEVDEFRRISGLKAPRKEDDKKYFMMEVKPDGKIHGHTPSIVIFDEMQTKHMKKKPKRGRRRASEEQTMSVRSAQINDLLDKVKKQEETATVHHIGAGNGLTSCCGKTITELSRRDRVSTSRARTTCNQTQS